MAARIDGKRVLMVISPVNFRDEELFDPKAVLEEAGAKVAVASKQAGEAKGMLGARVKPDLLLADAKPEDYDAVVVVGGSGSPDHLWGDATLHKLLKAVDGKQRVVGGICLSGAALARAGVLKGRRATVYKTPQSLAELREGGANYTGEAVTVDGRVVTGEGPHAAKEFGRRLVEALAGA